MEIPGDILESKSWATCIYTLVSIFLSKKTRLLLFSQALPYQHTDIIWYFLPLFLTFTDF